MQLETYRDFIEAAQSQSEPQRLLFVFTRRELPEDATEAQKTQFAAGEGGHLAPVLCVDKLPQQVPTIKKLTRESEQTGQDWDIAFVASMSGAAGQAPTSEQADQPLKMMVDSVKQGMISNFLAFDKTGELLRIL